MPSALILIADGTEEIEFVTPYDVLTRAGITVRSAGVNLKNEQFAVCSRNVKILPDAPSLDEKLRAEEFDALILPGGAPGAKAFCDSKTVLQLLRDFRGKGKLVGCICAGTTALVKSVETEGGERNKRVKVTSHPSVKEDIVGKGWDYSEERVVIDGKVVTSRGYVLTSPLGESALNAWVTDTVVYLQAWHCYAFRADYRGTALWEGEEGGDNRSDDLCGNIVAGQATSKWTMEYDGHRCSCGHTEAIDQDASIQCGLRVHARQTPILIFMSWRRVYKKGS